MVQRRARIALGTLLACGCPIPIPRDTVTREAIDFVVRDDRGAPVVGAKVLLLTGTDPHHRTESIEELATDVDGRAAFTERSEVITSFPLMMHGVGFYYWSWCVEAPHPSATSSAVADGPGPHVEVVLGGDAEGRHCVDRDGTMHARRNPPRAGLRLHYAVTPESQRSIEQEAETARDELGSYTYSMPKTFAFDVRVEGEQIVVDIAGLEAEELKVVLDAIVTRGGLELLVESQFGEGGAP